MNNKIRDGLFFSIVFSLVFTHIPYYWWMSFIGGPIGNKLVFFPVVISMGYTIYCHYRYRNIFCSFETFRKYAIVFIGVQILVYIHGYMVFPYWEKLLNTIEMQRAIGFLTNSSSEFLRNNSIIIVMICRIVRSIFVNFIFTFGLAYTIYCWYKNDKNSAFKVMYKALEMAFCLLMIYCFLQLLSIMDNEWAREVVETIEGYLHNDHGQEIGNTYVFWATTHIRGFFTEPSYFALYVALSIPFFWRQYFIFKKIEAIMAVLIMIFFLFLGQVRSAMVLLILLTVLLGIFVIKNHKNDRYFNRGIILLAGVFSTFVISQVFLSTYFYAQNGIQQTSQDYLKHNLLNVTNINQRSNRARFAMTYAGFAIGTNYPLLGVGSFFKPAYMEEYIPEWGIKSSEIREKIDIQRSKGYTKAPIPVGNFYGEVFSNSGILGSIVYFFPLFWIMCYLLRRVYRSLVLNIDAVFLLMSYMVILVSGFIMETNVTSYWWILLGLGFSITDNKKGGAVRI